MCASVGRGVSLQENELVIDKQQLNPPPPPPPRWGQDASVPRCQPGLCSRWTNTLLLQALPGVFSPWSGCCGPLPEQFLSHERWCSDLVGVRSGPGGWMVGMPSACQ